MGWGEKSWCTSLIGAIPPHEEVASHDVILFLLQIQNKTWTRDSSRGLLLRLGPWMLALDSDSSYSDVESERSSHESSIAD
jgi:hypothetical protein